MHKSSADAMQSSKCFCLYWIVCAQLATVPNLAPVAMSVEVLVTFSNPHNPFGGREFHLRQHNKRPQWQSTQMWRKKKRNREKKENRSAAPSQGESSQTAILADPFAMKFFPSGNSEAPTRFRKCHESLRWQRGRQKIEETSFLADYSFNGQTRLPRVME